MAKMMLIDTSKCIGCKACQIACQQWNQLPAEDTTFTGSYQNPPALSGINPNVVTFTEFEDNGHMKWLFFPNRCRHCVQPLCVNKCWEAWYAYYLGKGKTPKKAKNKDTGKNIVKKH